MPSSVRHIRILPFDRRPSACLWCGRKRSWLLIIDGLQKRLRFGGLVGVGPTGSLRLRIHTTIAESEPSTPHGLRVAKPPMYGAG